MKYTIKRNNNIIAQVVPQGNVSTKIMGEELVNMTFELPKMVKFQIGDMVNVYGANYYLLQAPVVEKVNTKHFKYSLQFGSIIYELSKIQLLFPDADNSCLLLFLFNVCTYNANYLCIFTNFESNFIRIL